MISNDLNNNKASMRVAISIEIVPICKDDLMCLSKRHHASLGSLGPIVICAGVTTVSFPAILLVNLSLRGALWRRPSQQCLDFNTDALFLAVPCRRISS